MKPKYQQVKQLKPFCSICNKILRGNGSMILPYSCECGEWNIDIKTGEYNLKKL